MRILDNITPIRFQLYNFIATLVIINMMACARLPLQDPLQAMRRTEGPTLTDDLDSASLNSALYLQLIHFGKLDQNRMLRFGQFEITVSAYQAALQKLLSVLERNGMEAFISQVHRDFIFMEVYGDKDWGDAFVTSYFEPILSATRTPDERHQQPIYRKPADMLALDTKEFCSEPSAVRKGRARISDGRVLPYHTREEIDSKGALAGRGLEICWVDPVDAFFLHVQGSGTMRFPDGSEVKLTYADKNGHPYSGLGPAIREKVPDIEITADTLEKYLRSLSRPEQQQLLNRNASYVFFTESKENAVTASGIPASAGRTIATDTRYFPKGALAFLQFTKPVRISSDEDLPSGIEKVGRFVLDQDAGGAITGGGRVDLFWGRGDEAKKFAGRVKSRGKLWYLFPKPESN